MATSGAGVIKIGGGGGKSGVASLAGCLGGEAGVAFGGGGAIAFGARDVEAFVGGSM